MNEQFPLAKQLPCTRYLEVTTLLKSHVKVEE